MSDEPVVADPNDFGNAFLVKNVDNIQRKPAAIVRADFGRLVGFPEPEHIRDDKTVAEWLEEGNLLAPQVYT